MKKVLVFLLVAMLVSASVFAVDFSVGLASGYEQEIAFFKGGDSSSLSQVPIKATATIDVLDNFAVGIDLGMGINLENINFFLPETKVGFVADVAAYYRLALSQSFALYLGGGLGYDLVAFEMGPADYSFNTLDIFVDVKASYDVMNNLAIFGGAKFGFDILKNAKMSLPGGSTTKNMLEDYTSCIQWGLSVGAAYKF